MYDGTVLSRKCCRHEEPCLAEIPISSKCGILALREVQFEAVDRYVGYLLECAAGYVRLAVDERRTDEFHGHAISLQHHDQRGEFFTGMTHKIRRSF